MKKAKQTKCAWEFHRAEGRKKYVKCKRCGRVKRDILPDVHFCSGSNAAYQSLMSQITGRDLSNQDLRELEKMENDQERKDGKYYLEDHEEEDDEEDESDDDGE